MTLHCCCLIVFNFEKDFDSKITLIDTFMYRNLHSIFLVFSLNILIYLVTLFVLFILIFSQKNLKLNNLQDLFSFFKISFFKFSFLICILSLAGIPPFSGFFLKFFMFYVLCFKKNTIIFITIFFLNFLSIFFYLQNIKFLIKINNYKNKSMIIKKNFYFLDTLVIFIFFIIFGFFFMETIIIFLINFF